MTTASYDVPDYNLTDTDADARDAYDLRKEAEKQAAWDEMLSDDGDIGVVIEWLGEHAEDVLPLIKAYHNGECLKDAAHRLAVRLHGLTEAAIEEGL